MHRVSVKVIAFSWPRENAENQENKFVLGCEYNEEKLAHYKEWVKPGNTLEETAISELESLLAYLEKATPDSFSKTIPYAALPYLALQEQRREIEALRKKIEAMST